MSTETELLAVSAAWDAALVDNDAGAVASFMADEWVFVSPSGITPKAELIEWIAMGRLAHHAMEPVGPPRVAIHRRRRDPDRAEGEQRHVGWRVVHRRRVDQRGLRPARRAMDLRPEPQGRR